MFKLEIVIDQMLEICSLFRIESESESDVNCGMTSDTNSKMARELRAGNDSLLDFLPHLS